MAISDPYQEKRNSLYELLVDHFNLEEIEKLIFKLGIDEDEVPGDTKSAKGKELILYVERYGKLYPLLELVREERPAVDWPDFGSGTEEEVVDTGSSEKAGGEDNVVETGDVYGSLAAIGEGAQAIDAQLQEVLDGLDEEGKAAEYSLVEAIKRKNQRFTDLTDKDKAFIIAGRKNPYKWRDADYKTVDAPNFFGRGAAINKLLDQVLGSKFSVLAAESGLGRASLLKAGLASRLLERKIYPLYIRPIDMTPEEAIKKSFLSGIDSDKELAVYKTMGLKQFLEEVTDLLGNHDLIIFLDQFKEFFDELSEEEQKKFAEQLYECAYLEDSLPVSWVISINIEYLPKLRLRFFEDLEPPQRLILEPFTFEEAWEAITQPAALVDVTFEGDLCETILEDIIAGESYEQGEHIIPPVLVELVGFKLFEELQSEEDKSLLTSDLYNRLGGAEGIFVKHLADMIENDLSGADAKVAWQVLKALPSPKMEQRVKRKEIPVMVGDDVDQEVIDRVLTKLISLRLVHESFNDENESELILIHDFLLRAIPKEG